MIKEKTEAVFGRNPYFVDGAELPALPQSFNELDDVAAKRYREEMELWWEETKENLVKMRDEIISFEVRESEARSAGGLEAITKELDDLKSLLKSYLYGNILIHDLPADQSWLD